MTETPAKPAKPVKVAKPPAKRAAPRAAGNGRSRRAETAAVQPASTAVMRERGAEMIPGSSLVMHRFMSGPLTGKPWIGAGGIEYSDVEPVMSEIAARLATWTEDQRLRASAGPSMLDRNAYVTPDNVFEQMRMAQRASENDDMVGGLLDATEGLALKGLHWESANLDDADVFNQWSGAVDLDNFIRVSWRELSTISQYVAARWWGFRDFKVRGNGAPKLNQETGLVERDDEGKIKKGSKRRKEYRGVYVPLGLTVLDSTKVLPLGSLMFGMERLVWAANADEMQTWQQIADGKISRQADPILAAFFVRKYTPSQAERDMIRKLDTGINPETLLEMNSDYVWRHTLTRAHYRPWADVRLKRAFRWLDLKQQLMAADRVALVGNANYILLVTKGEEKNPATQEEIDDLNANFNYVARLPVIIGDHTLKIDIISPKSEFTLKDERYDTVDRHIRDTVLATFPTEYGQSGETTAGVGRAISRGLDNRRHGIRRDYETNLGRAIFEHPFNQGKFEEDPNLVFDPRNINLEADPSLQQAIIAFAARGDLSRETSLSEFGFDQAMEALRREREAEWYDPIFRSATPYSGGGNPFAPDGAPGNNGGGALPPGAGGGGGRPPGGQKPDGAPTPASPTPKKRTRTPRGKNRATT